jgi:hypothetical protein
MHQTTQVKKFKIHNFSSNYMIKRKEFFLQREEGPSSQRKHLWSLLRVSLQQKLNKIYLEEILLLPLLPELSSPEVTTSVPECHVNGM